MKVKAKPVAKKSRASAQEAAALEGTAPRQGQHTNSNSRVTLGHSATIHQDSHHVTSHTADIIIKLL